MAFRIVCLSVFHLLLISCTHHEIVIDELSQREANEVLVLLRGQKIAAEKVGQAVKKTTVYQIKVKKEQAEVALRLLVENQIPKTYRASLKEVFAPGTAGLIPTKADEIARMTMAMQGEIEALLKVIPGIADARVVISYEPSLDYQKITPKKTASVALIYLPQQDHIPLSELEVKNLIASSITGLLPEDVMVVERVLKPVEYLNTSLLEKPINNLSSDTLLSTKAAFSPWILMALTIIALIIAAYAVVRITLQKKQA